MKKIYWIASYPKSGNTWFRAFLGNLKAHRDTPISINELSGAPIASHRPTFDRFNGVSAVNLFPDEVDRLRPRTYRLEAESAPGPLFKKVHDAYLCAVEDGPLFPPDITAGVVYIIRNPLDVAVSYAHYLGCTMKEAIERMGDPGYALCRLKDRAGTQLRQRLLTWSQHVVSWIDTSDLPIHVVRYEDMKYNSIEAFKSAARFCGLSDDTEEVSRAVRFCAFDVLQAQEEEHGFKEKHSAAGCFFRKGQPGEWREALSDEDVRRVIRKHGDIMRRFGYLSKEDKPIF